MNKVLFLACLSLLLTTCNVEQKEEVEETSLKQERSTYALLKTLKPGEKIQIRIPEEVMFRNETEVCHCNAKITHATPPQGSFYVWAVGVYHSLPMFNCFYPQGPVGLLWNQGDEYSFSLCKSLPQIILEFAVAPPSNPAQWVPVSVTVQLMCNDGVVQSLEGVRYHTFTAEAGETVEDERAFFSTGLSCIPKPR